MPVISQGLAVPAGLVDGQVATAEQITPLYTAMNAFVIPAAVGVFQLILADNTTYSTTAGTTQNWSVTLPQDKAFFFFIPFVTAAQHTSIQLFLNSTAVTTASDVSPNTGAGDVGIVLGFCGPHDATFSWPLLVFEISSTDTLGTGTVPFLYAAAIPNASITTLGLKVTTHDCQFKGLRIFGEV